MSSSAPTALVISLAVLSGSATLAFIIWSLRRYPRTRRQAGFALEVSLLITVLMLIMGIGLAASVNSSESSIIKTTQIGIIIAMVSLAIGIGNILLTVADMARSENDEKNKK